MKLAVLDDYQQLALKSADWGVLQGVEVKVFDAPFASLDDAARKLEPFDILCLMRERMPFPRELVVKLPKLRFVSLTGRRAGSLDSKALAERGIPVSHTGAGNGTASTVELAWGLILAAARNLAKAERNMRSGKWHQGLPAGMALAGKRLGLIGAGGIGAKVGAVGKAFGMDVVGWSQNLTPEKAEAAGVRYVAKDELLSTSDVVTIHMVLSDRTRNLLGKKDLERLKPGAILVNTSRGPIVDEAALLEWLKTGAGHAALDVYDREPLPADHALRKLENVTLSPHLGYVNEENYRTFYR
ncbi:MAG TPA: D-2-hydroxyacid dehydrogenase family protein, partial [Methyloceanibacter sp.]|nr:D-2-hydroxyacid dehydrogenase family protein [Methyloceanibacter sp.]